MASWTPEQFLAEERSYNERKWALSNSFYEVMDRQLKGCGCNCSECRAGRCPANGTT